MATDVITEVVEAPGSSVSWGAVIAGGFASVAVSMLLLAFGAGVGFSSVSPWSGQGVSATTFHIAAGIYLIVVAMLSSTIGGYIAGRLRTRWLGVHADEVYFRDTAHGVLSWAVATAVGAVMLGSASSHLIGGATAVTAGNATDTYVDMLLRADPAAPPAATTAAAGSTEAVRAELGRTIVAASGKDADVSAADRTYLAKVVSARTGLNQADAERRVSEVITSAKKAADDARSAAAKLALWLAASMLAGALAAGLAAVEGGVLRDSRWYEPGWRKGMGRI
jgi:hypothetical protein